jgi:O-antigen/teichoic acid export membrane protein
MDFLEGIKDEEGFLKNIFNRFKKKDFSGTTGQAMKNSSYQLAQNLIFKVGSLLFTIVIARMLLPDLMGLYNLALATIILFASFSDLGVGAALITFAARKLGKGDLNKAKGYAKKLFRWKLLLVFISSGILLVSSYFIAEVYYAKPIFYALLVGAIYLPVASLLSFVESMFKSTENFKTPLKKEILFQTSRFVLVPLAIFIFLRMGISNQEMIALTILTLTLVYLISLSFLIVKSKKKINFLQVVSSDLKRDEIKELKKFIYPLSATAMAGMFFGYIDTLMLGHFVSSKFIAYYGAAFSLVGGVSAIIGFMAISLMPIFAKKSGKALESIFKKARNLTISISILAGIFTYFVANSVIQIVYGTEYLPAAPVLKAFSMLIVIIPIIGLYGGYFTTQKKTKELAWLIFGSAILNILFNWFGISYGLNNYGEIGAVFGAVGATILSRGLYFVGLVRFRKN